VDFLPIGVVPGARSQSESPGGGTRKHLGRTKLVAALAVAALVGAGTYTATYRALVILSTPSALAPIHAPGPTTDPTATALALRSDA
jgi:hypothetical protein